MKKYLFLSIFLIFLITEIRAQNNVGIGVTTPESRSILELSANDKGLLIPRLTTAQRKAIDTVSFALAIRGLLVYDIDFVQFWYFDGTKWVRAIGPSGPTGPAGANGATGANGIVGPTGPAGINGAVGPTGPAGSNGVAGPTGPAGINGINGAAGPTGPAGTNGSNGAVGPTGPAGANGTNGINGTNGAAGATGPTGNNGLNGAVGPTGPAGTNGIAGATGPTGDTGPVGPTGVGMGPTGPTGAAGANGAVGATGPAGTNGTNGAVGPTGPAGTNGTNGAVGPTGPAGTNGTNGAVGPTGPAGTNGTNGAVGATGPAGTNGTNGTNGAAGATGPTGPTWTLSLPTINANGTVTVNGTAGSGGPVTSANAAWTTLGNSGTVAGTNFIGSTDNVSVDVRTNNQIQARFLNNGQVGINTLVPLATDYLAVTSDATFNYAVNGYCTSAPLGNGIYGEVSNTANQKASIWGDCFSTNAAAAGCLGQYLGVGGAGYGVRGFTDQVDAVGVYGYRDPNPGAGFGGLFENDLGYTGTLYNLSDMRLKKDIVPLANALDIINKLVVYTYKFDLSDYPNLGEDIKHFGFISQEVEKVVPELVREKSYDLLNNKPNKKDSFVNYAPNVKAKAMNYIEIIPITVQALKEQQVVIDSLKTDNLQLQNSIKEQTILLNKLIEQNKNLEDRIIKLEGKKD